MSAAGLDALARACDPITAPGSDPESVATLLAWAIRPRRSLESLRRALSGGPDAGDGDLQAVLRAHARPHVDGDDLRLAHRPVELWRRNGCQLSVVGDPGYPAKLAEGWPATDGPVLLVSAGTPAITVPTVAIVGSRAATGYGAGIAAWLAEAAGAAGAHVLSGGAVGIDAAAHRAALGSAGGTSVVLGCGHDVSYPRAHARPGGLFEEVRAQGGALLSEQFPQVQPKAGVVRARNRIVAGLADVVVVVEGGARSGALLTATAAFERDRTVMAVPGDVRAPGSVAPNRLLGEGGHPCTEPQDLLDALAISGSVGAVDAASCAPTTANTPDRGVPGGPTDEAVGGHRSAGVLSVLPDSVHAALTAAWPRALPVDLLLERAGLGAGAVLAALTRAQVAGEVVEGPEGVVLRRRPHAAGTHRDAGEPTS